LNKRRKNVAKYIRSFCLTPQERDISIAR
jgi:hypothetical protein